MNNDFCVIRDAICKWSLANGHTRDPKLVIHGNSCIILYILHSNDVIILHWYYEIFCHCPLLILYRLIACYMVFWSPWMHGAQDKATKYLIQYRTSIHQKGDVSRVYESPLYNLKSVLRPSWFYESPYNSDGVFWATSGPGSWFQNEIEKVSNSQNLDKPIR